MTNENFFKHDDKAYAENLNDAILIANSFNYQVPVNIPSMYSNHHYPSNNNTYKAGVADITIISSGSLSIGDEAITNNTNSSQILRLRIYPNFNNFYAWEKLNWTCTGDVTVNICDTGTNTSLLPSGALTNPNNEILLNGISSLQGLKEYDLLITIPANGILNTLSIVFINNWNSSNRISASISQANVSGLVDDLSSLESGKADTEHTHSSTDVTESNALENIGTTIGTPQSQINEAVDEMVGSLSDSITNLIQVQEVNRNTPSISAGGTSKQIFTVTACPTGYTWNYFSTSTGWGTGNSLSLSGTTLTVNVLNVSNGSHSISFRGVLVYYPTSWSI